MFKVLKDDPYKMNSHPRHDFLKSTITTLRENVAGLCSNPDCRVLTVASVSDKDKTLNLGVAAHICAAAPGGPRYNPVQTKDERRAYENGIWLCSTCSRLIDDDADSYSVVLLNSWKSQTIEYVRSNVGKQMLPKDEIETRAIAETLNYVGGRDPAALFNKGAMAVKHFDKHLSQLDNRFSVQTNVINGNTQTLITPIAENVSVKVTMDRQTGRAFDSQLKEMRTSGKPVTIPTSSISFSGSKLFEAVTDGLGESGELRIEPHATKIKLSLYAILNGKHLYLGEFNGKQYILDNGIKFTAYAFNKFLKITMFYDANKGTLQYNFVASVEQWGNKSLNKIPYFKRLLSAKDILLNGGILGVSIEFEEGHELNPFEAEKDFSSETKRFFASIGELVHVVDCVKKLSSHFKLPEPTFCGFEIPENEFKALTTASVLTEGDIHTSGTDVGSFDFSMPKEHYERLPNQGSEFPLDRISFVENSPIPTVFGTSFDFLKIEHTYFNMNVKTVEHEESVSVYLEPTGQSSSVVSLIDERNKTSKQ
ncbi:hypothetical protein [Vibrio hepatarius]|uniref:hypothetical protein n=1 Tax=Vibrio hepatarius TaxID=171383 RepID=UPI0006A944D3|nr:hypothetical protein [Vibrio hepatarius]